MNKCQGLCKDNNECIGEVTHVFVSKGETNWGGFWYCETAIEADEKNGFEVITWEEASEVSEDED